MRVVGGPPCARCGAIQARETRLAGGVHADLCLACLTEWSRRGLDPDGAFARYRVAVCAREAFASIGLVNRIKDAVLEELAAEKSCFDAAEAFVAERPAPGIPGVLVVQGDTGG